MYMILIVIFFILLAGLALFYLVKPVINANYEEKVELLDEPAQTAIQRGKYECLLPNQRSH